MLIATLDRRRRPDVRRSFRLKACAAPSCRSRFDKCRQAWHLRLRSVLIRVNRPARGHRRQHPGRSRIASCSGWRLAHYREYIAMRRMLVGLIGPTSRNPCRVAARTRILAAAAVAAITPDGRAPLRAAVARTASSADRWLRRFKSPILSRRLYSAAHAFNEATEICAVTRCVRQERSHPRPQHRLLGFVRPHRWLRRGAVRGNRCCCWGRRAGRAVAVALMRLAPRRCGSRHDQAAPPAFAPTIIALRPIAASFTIRKRSRRSRASSPTPVA